MQEWPALRPLVLVLKALLKDAALNDVSTGGLSSFTLANMVLAHLLEETEVRPCDVMCSSGTGPLPSSQSVSQSVS